MSKFIGISIGTIFGKWTTLAEALSGNRSQIYYPCRCICGTERNVAVATLLNGTSKGCKACSIKHKNDIHIGDKFSRWTIISEYILGSSSNRRGIFFICRCDCGTEKEISANSLRQGTSTGCSKCADYKPRLRSTIFEPGDTFYDWTVVKLEGSDKSRALIWDCVCKCGRHSMIRTEALLKGTSKRCRSCSSKLRRNHLAYSYSSKNKGYLYCVRSGRYIKIGFATDMDKRLEDLQSENPEDLEVIWIREGEGHLEEAWHLKLKALGLHHRGEWFYLPEDMSILEKL